MKYVYLLKAGDSHYKVGVSTNVTRRVTKMQTGNGNHIDVVATKLCHDCFGVERAIHRKLKAMGSGGGSEWFVLEPEDALQVAIDLNKQPEIDVYVNTDLNKQLREQLLRYKSLEKKLDAVLNIAQKRKSGLLIAPLEPTEDKIRQPLDKSADDQELYATARHEVEKANKASTSFLQRKLKIGYGRAARVIEHLEEQGVIGPADGSKPRRVLTVEASRAAKELVAV